MNYTLCTTVIRLVENGRNCLVGCFLVNPSTVAVTKIIAKSFPYNNDHFQRTVLIVLRYFLVRILRPFHHEHRWPTEELFGLRHRFVEALDVIAPAAMIISESHKSLSRFTFKIDVYVKVVINKKVEMKPKVI